MIHLPLPHLSTEASYPQGVGSMTKMFRLIVVDILNYVFSLDIKLNIFKIIYSNRITNLL